MKKFIKQILETDIITDLDPTMVASQNSYCWEYAYKVSDIIVHLIELCEAYGGELYLRLYTESGDPITQELVTLLSDEETKAVEEKEKARLETARRNSRYNDYLRLKKEFENN